MKKEKEKSRLKTWQKVLISLTVIFAIIVIGGTTYFYSLYNKMDKVTLDKDDLGLPSEDELDSYSKSKDIVNIALFGIDAEDGKTGRSDSIMVATLDPVHKKLKLTSFMRDSYVEIPGRAGKDKINHAYAFGGPQLAIKTLNQNFGLNISQFASVNFESLPKIIDAIGGIELNITSEELKYINGYIDNLNKIDGTNATHITTAGKQHVNGIQALAYSRIRYTSGGDYKRTERHRTVMSALFDKILATPASSYPSLVNKLLPFVQTNLTPSEILSLGNTMLNVGSSSLEQERFPRDNNCRGIKVNSIYYLDYDRDITIKQVRDYIFEDIK